MHMESVSSMAVTSFPSRHILLFHKSGPAITKPVSTIMMAKHSKIALKKATALAVRSSLQNKVFENRSEGIVCYVDDSGEIICEGYDEGPRFHQQLPRLTSCHPHPRDAVIINLLQQRLLQIVNGCDVNNVTDNGVVVVQEDFFNWNGLNKFC